MRLRDRQILFTVRPFFIPKYISNHPCFVLCIWFWYSLMVTLYSRRSLLESLKIYEVNSTDGCFNYGTYRHFFSCISILFTFYSYIIHGIKYRKQNFWNISRLLWQQKWIDETRTQFILLIRGFHSSSTFFDHFLATCVYIYKVRSSTHSQAY